MNLSASCSEVHPPTADSAEGASLQSNPACADSVIEARRLLVLAQDERGRGELQRAFPLARRGLEALRDLEGFGLESAESCAWQLWEEVMLTAFYADENAAGLAACERLLCRRDASQAQLEYVANNERYYVNRLGAARRGVFVVSEKVLDGRFLATNPTVTGLNDRIVANVRLLNFRHHEHLWYVPTDPDGIIRTRNVSLELDGAFSSWIEERESTVAFPADWHEDVATRGLEDMRWITHNGRVWFTATCFQVPEHPGSPQVVLGRMNAALDAVEHLVAVRYDAATHTEKNWVPWSRNGTLYLIYSYDPFVVLHVDPTTGVATPAFHSEPSWNATRYRGSTPPVRIPGSRDWLAITHEVAFTSTGRVYLHRFVVLTDRFRLAKKSKPFVFDHHGIEYAAGLCLLGERELLVTYGWKDREARWLTIDWEAVLGELGEAEPSNPLVGVNTAPRQLARLDDDNA